MGFRSTLPRAAGCFCTVDLNLYGYIWGTVIAQRFGFANMKSDAHLNLQYKTRSKPRSERVANPTEYFFFHDSHEITTFMNFAACSHLKPAYFNFVPFPRPSKVHGQVPSTCSIHVSPHIRRCGPPRAGSRRRCVSSATALLWLVSITCRSMVL